MRVCVSVCLCACVRACVCACTCVQVLCTTIHYTIVLSYHGLSCSSICQFAIHPVIEFATSANCRFILFTIAHLPPQPDGPDVYAGVLKDYTKDVSGSSEGCATLHVHTCSIKIVLKS